MRYRPCPCGGSRLCTEFCVWTVRKECKNTRAETLKSSRDIWAQFEERELTWHKGKWHSRKRDRMCTNVGGQGGRSWSGNASLHHSAVNKPRAQRQMHPALLLPFSDGVLKGMKPYRKGFASLSSVFLRTEPCTHHSRCIGSLRTSGLNHLEESLWEGLPVLGPLRTLLSSQGLSLLRMAPSPPYHYYSFTFGKFHVPLGHLNVLPQALRAPKHQAGPHIPD